MFLIVLFELNCNLTAQMEGIGKVTADVKIVSPSVFKLSVCPSVQALEATHFVKET